MTIDDVLTASEAAELYNLNDATLRKACAGQKGLPPIFTSEECRKSGRTWLILKSAMERIYGKKR